MRKLHGVILFVLIALGGGALWLLFGREPIQEGRCRLRRQAIENPAKNQVAELVCQFLEPELSRPDNVKDPPQGFDQPCFYHIEINGERLAAVLDWSHGRLCLDTDRDGLFSDERCFQAKLVKLTRRGSPRRRFGPIRLSIEKDAGQERVAFYALQPVADRPTFLSVYPAYCRSGRLRIDGRIYQVAVADGDYDGRFSSVVSLPAGSGAIASLPPEYRRLMPRSDIFAVDSNRDGKFELFPAGACSPEVMPLSRMVLLGSNYYAIDISSDGSELELTRVEPTLGHLAVVPPNATLQLRLWSDAAAQDIPRSSGPWDLPVGTYQTLHALLILRDSSDDDWAFTTLPNVGDLTWFQIQPGQTTRLRIGPPFVVKADVRRAGAGIVSINPIVVGCAGEQYQADFRRNWRRAPERMFKIVDEKGTVLVADKFQYG